MYLSSDIWLCAVVDPNRPGTILDMRATAPWLRDAVARPPTIVHQLRSFLETRCGAGCGHADMLAALRTAFGAEWGAIVALASYYTAVRAATVARATVHESSALVAGGVALFLRQIALRSARHVALASRTMDVDVWVADRSHLVPVALVMRCALQEEGGLGPVSCCVRSAAHDQRVRVAADSFWPMALHNAVSTVLKQPAQVGPHVAATAYPSNCIVVDMQCTRTGLCVQLVAPRYHSTMQHPVGSPCFYPVGVDITTFDIDVCQCTAAVDLDRDQLVSTSSQSDEVICGSQLRVTRSSPSYSLARVSKYQLRGYPLVERE